MKLGVIIKDYREYNKLSLGDMANRTGFSKTYISMLENNYNPSTKKPITPTSVTLKKCADAMNMTIHELVKMLDPDQLIDLVYAENLTPAEHTLVSDFRQLNPVGQEKAAGSVHDLTEIPRYRADSNNEETPLPEEKSASSA